MSSDPIRTRPAGVAGLVAAALLLSFMTGCGKQGPPLPPLRNVPAPAKDLTVAQRGPRVVLSFSYPKTTPGGAALGGITGVELYELARPAPSTGTPPAVDPKQFTALAKKPITLQQADIGPATLGDRLVLDLPVPEPLPQPAEARYYSVRTLGPDGSESELSNQVAVVLKAPPAAPEKVEVTPEAGGVRVNWTAVPSVLGYAVYRRGAQERVQAKPIALIAGAETVTYTDPSAQFGQSYIYSVTAVTQREPFLESAIQKEQEVRYVDRFAPPVPTDVVALAQAGRVRLVWKTVEAVDLAGYLVFRRLNEASEFDKITASALVTPEFSDTDVVSGKTYVYRVKAIDTAGNESDPSPAAVAQVP
jgi:predicted small lipoprotein YifL